MSWLTDLMDYTPAGVLHKGLDTMTKGIQNDISPDSGLSGIRDVADFYQSEVSDKYDLRKAQALSVASGLPVVGSILKGIEGANQLEDYYDNSNGKVPEYPAGSGLSASGIGAGMGSIGFAASRSDPGYKAGKMSLEDLYLSYY